MVRRKDDEPVAGRSRAVKLPVAAEGGGDVHAAERVAGGVEDANAVGVERRKDDAPIGGRRHTVKLVVDAEGGGDGDAAERVSGGVEDAHAVGEERRKDDEPVGGRRRTVKLAVDAASTVLRVDQIIMSKAAGGPRPPGPGGMDED